VLPSPELVFVIITHVMRILLARVVIFIPFAGAL
jgi:hypothetical protein